MQPWTLQRPETPQQSVKPEADPFERLHDDFEQALTTLRLRAAGAARNALPRWSVGTIKTRSQSQSNQTWVKVELAD